MELGSACETMEISKVMTHLLNTGIAEILCIKIGKMYELGVLRPSRHEGRGSTSVLECRDGDSTYRFSITVLEETNDKYKIRVCWVSGD